MTDEMKRILQLSVADGSKRVREAEKLKGVLQQPGHLRDAEDVELLTKGLEESKFFKERSHLMKHDDIKELSNYMQFS